jgi:4-alpha-glucanotransferase
VTDSVLAALAAEHGVATSFVDWQGRAREVDTETVLAVLHALGVDVTTPWSREQALAEVENERWRRALPRTVVMRAGTSYDVAVHCPHGEAVRIYVRCEDGAERADIEQIDRWVEPRWVDGQLRGEATFRLPADLPTGYHRLYAVVGDEPAETLLVVAPQELALGRLESGRVWGIAVQLYSVCSTGSWGIGDFADLRGLVRWARSYGAGAVQVNPLHAPGPSSPIEASPYYPSSRRYVSPLYLRPEDTVEYARAGWGTRARVDDERPPKTGDRIDRDVVWSAKRTALRLLWSVARNDPDRRAALDAFRQREGDALERFATWNALAERHGVPWQRWPEALRRPDSPAVAKAAAELEDLVAFHAWLQLLCDEQLSAVAEEAADMAVGVVSDLAVGVDPGGADAWSLSDVLALGASVGAPPDAFNQRGQNWRQPPWRPDRLADTEYAAYRALLRAVLRHAGGVRVDHVLGLFRLWWIPEGNKADDGTYVSYDADAMLGILTLEAERAGAVVIGEDLGTVPPGLRETLADRGILGTTVLWFAASDGYPEPPERWRQHAAATVTTHDLPTVAGLLELSHVDLRARLGLLTRGREEERANEAAVRDAWLDLARERRLLADNASLDEQVAALHDVLVASPSRLVLIGLPDVVGDRQQQNQPGTTDSYPNWCVPLTRGEDAVPVLIDELADDASVSAALGRIDKGMRGASGG